MDQVDQQSAGKSGRRRTTKPKLENHYKELGLRANVRQEDIKPQYIRMVKQYPPEKFPEEFQRIRKAYELLRDPVKRKEYDIKRKPGKNPAKMLLKAWEHMKNQEHNKAEKLLLQILQLEAAEGGEDFSREDVWVTLASILTAEESDLAYTNKLNKYRHAASSDDDRAMLYNHLARLLNNNGEAELALIELEEACELYPDIAPKLQYSFMHIYSSLRRPEAWPLAESLIPSLQDDNLNSQRLFTAFTDWLRVMFELGRLNMQGRIAARFKALMRVLDDTEERKKLFEEFDTEASTFTEGGLYNRAAAYLEFASIVDPAVKEIRARQRHMHELARSQRELERMLSDLDMFPMLPILAFQWFYEENRCRVDPGRLREQTPPHILEELEQHDELYAAGIARLRKKYPLLYTRFRKKWDMLYEEKTKGLNREERRRLR